MRVRKIQKRNILPGTRAVRRGKVAAFVFRMRPICRRLYVFATAFNITKEEERVEQKKIRHNKKKKTNCTKSRDSTAFLPFLLHPYSPVSPSKYTRNSTLSLCYAVLDFFKSKMVRFSRYIHATWRKYSQNGHQQWNETPWRFLRRNVVWALCVR